MDCLNVLLKAGRDLEVVIQMSCYLETPCPGPKVGIPFLRWQQSQMQRLKETKFAQDIIILADSSESQGKLIVKEW